MTENPEEGTLAHHLEHLAADADAVNTFLTQAHEEGGDIHPEALGKAERLSTSLRDVIHALTHNEHLAMTSDDIWHALTIQHGDHDDDITLT